MVCSTVWREGEVLFYTCGVSASGRSEEGRTGAVVALAGIRVVVWGGER